MGRIVKSSELLKEVQHARKTVVRVLYESRLLAVVGPKG